MTNVAEIINFPVEAIEQEQERVKADVDNGYYRVANELGLALCKVHLSDRESRILHAVMLKTFGFNKSLDWICNEQLSELTGIDVSNISKAKKTLVDRKIIITEGRKFGINTVVSEWENKSKPTFSDNLKKSQNRLSKKSEPTSRKSKPTFSGVETDPHKRQDNTTKDNTTKDSGVLNIPEWLPVDVWNEFVQMRKTIKKPLTENAKVRMINKLCKFHNSGFNAVEQLVNSINNCWSDIYEPKNINAYQKAKPAAENFHLKDYGKTQIPEWMQEPQS